jgi:hypothetical protein
LGRVIFNAGDWIVERIGGLMSRALKKEWDGLHPGVWALKPRMESDYCQLGPNPVGWRAVRHWLP